MEWLLKSPIALGMAGLGAGFVLALYWLGATVDDVEEKLNETQELPYMPVFDHPDDAIDWHRSQIKKIEDIKKRELDVPQLLNMIESLKQEIEDLKGNQNA